MGIWESDREIWKREKEKKKKKKNGGTEVDTGTEGEKKKQPDGEMVKIWWSVFVWLKDYIILKVSFLGVFWIFGMKN